MNYEQNCMKDCGYYDVAEHKTCHSDQFCAKQPVCNGRILNCQYIDSDMRICQSVRCTNKFNFKMINIYKYVNLNIFFRNLEVIDDMNIYHTKMAKC